MPKLITPERAALAVVTCMCRYGHMNGWFGDVSKDFRTEQAQMLMDKTADERKKWIEQNHFNLTRYCGVPERILMVLRRPSQTTKPEMPREESTLRTNQKVD